MLELWIQKSRLADSILAISLFAKQHIFSGDVPNPDSGFIILIYNLTGAEFRFGSELWLLSQTLDCSRSSFYCGDLKVKFCTIYHPALQKANQTPLKINHFHNFIWDHSLQCIETLLCCCFHCCLELGQWFFIIHRTHLHEADQQRKEDFFLDKIPFLVLSCILLTLCT